MSERPPAPDGADLPYRTGVEAVFDVVHRLRAPDGCPWDREQTHQSLRPYLLEETYELLEAIDRGDDAKLVEELGDVLLQVAMHAQIAAQEGRFDAAEVSEREAAKMVSRHPHVFGDVKVADASEVLLNWEHGKAAEAHVAGRRDETTLDRVPRSLPGLAWALNLQKRAARVGFDYDSPSAAAEGVAEAAREAAQAAPTDAFDEVGDLLFAVVALARKLKVNPEDALRLAGQRFKDRFDRMERAARARGQDLRSLEDGERRRLWEESPAS